MRVEQLEGCRGSLKWMQRSVAEGWPDLVDPILAALPGAKRLDWVSPLQDDKFAEYRDEAWLARIGRSDLAASLAEFWPKLGPQWDALAVTDAGHVVLVEAKAHIGEFCSPPSQASPASMARIVGSLTAVAADLGVAADNRADWSRHFYQYANRLAHLHWLRGQGVDAKLALVGFVHDDDMPGRTTKEAWEAAYLLADSILGLHKRHPLRPHLIHVHPEVDRH